VPLQTPHCDAVRGRTARVPVRRRIEGEIEIAPPVEIMFETTRSRTPTRFFFSRVLQPFEVNLLGTTVYQDMRRMEELFRNSNGQRDGWLLLTWSAFYCSESSRRIGQASRLALRCLTSTRCRAARDQG
jgi:hypothetical protein